ncbi:MAG: DUF1343 domain-containing protein [Anaerolineae bacterium]|nr:DUF1343 domain-containing protein [Anaerolineae bacterium]
MASRQVITGIEALRAQKFAPLRGKRVGLLTNPSAVDRLLNSTLDILRSADEVQLVALFSPEHGIAAAVADGEPVASGRDPRTGLTLHSLYGETTRPTPDMLRGLDVIVCDIQDIGVRYYTFTWTITHVLEAAGEAGIEVMILDRPNPLGGKVAGAPLEPALTSLVGRVPVPTQPGMTLGELARLFNATWNPTPAALSVIACEGYRRGMMWAEIGLPFVPPSPNMPHLVTAQHYPGACLVEGTTLSEGRGTALPFEIFGAPGLNGHALAEALNKQDWDGVRFRPHYFQPAANKHAGVMCGGVQAHITDAAAYRPLRVWLGVLAAILSLYTFEWNAGHFDRLIGVHGVRERIDAGEALDDLFAQWEQFCRDFAVMRTPYLLYE